MVGLPNGIKWERSPEIDMEWYTGYIFKLENLHAKEYYSMLLTM